MENPTNREIPEPREQSRPYAPESCPGSRFTIPMLGNANHFPGRSRYSDVKERRPSLHEYPIFAWDTQIFCSRCKYVPSWQRASTGIQKELRAFLIAKLVGAQSLLAVLSRKIRHRWQNFSGQISSSDNSLIGKAARSAWSAPACRRFGIVDAYKSRVTIYSVVALPRRATDSKKWAWANSTARAPSLSLLDRL